MQYTYFPPQAVNAIHLPSDPDSRAIEKQNSQLNSATLQNIRPQVIIQSHQPRPPLHPSHQRLPDLNGFSLPSYAEKTQNFTGQGHIKTYIHPNPSSYTNLHNPMHSEQIRSKTYMNTYKPISYDSNASIVNSESQIVPVLLHDPTMVSPAPSSCSSLNSSSVQLSSPASNSNQPALSTFQYPSPSHDGDGKSIMSRKILHHPLQAYHHSVPSHHQQHRPTQHTQPHTLLEINTTRTEPSSSRAHRLGDGVSCSAPQPHENLGIDLESLPPPLELSNDSDSTVADDNTSSVLDHREEEFARESEGDPANSGTMRRSKKCVYTNGKH